MKPSPGALAHGSYYTLKECENPIYGAWSDQIIMGEACTIHARQLPDGSQLACDALGCAGAFREKGIAIHISGISDTGGQAQPGWIRALASYQIEWTNPKGHHCSGLGCDGPEAAAIVDEGTHYGGWKHFAHYADCDGFWTLEGIYYTFRDTANFTAADVVEVANRVRHQNQYVCLDDQHVRSARRLMEACVGASNNQIPGAPTLRRFGRWAYTWRRDA